ncbi:High mobility group box domain [Phaffia rhodozyma]|uniref:High mobility group box domain n=1 Tax=Phaffia rhodozyma TaxID=264483 RepID=A0A0F7SNA7_PHARH|nr:High mobility group box domain [Phaffia rhodozyma]
MPYPPRFSLSSFRLFKPKAPPRTCPVKKPRSQALEEFYASQRNKGVAKLPGPIDIRKRPRDTAFTTFAKERLSQLHLIPLQERPQGSMAVFMAKAWEELPYDEKKVYIKRSTDAVKVWEDALVKWRAALTEAEQDSAQTDAELSPLLFRKVPSDPPETYWKLDASSRFWGALVSRSTFREEGVRAINPTDVSNRSDATNGLLELFEHMMDGRDLAHPVGRVCSIYKHYDNDFFTSQDLSATPPPRNKQLQKVWFLYEYKKIWFLVYQSPQSLINFRVGVNRRF